MVAKGRLDNNGVFVAEEVLAKHDESYMPKELQDAMQEVKDANSTGSNYPKYQKGN